VGGVHTNDVEVHELTKFFLLTQWMLQRVHVYKNRCQFSLDDIQVSEKNFRSIWKRDNNRDNNREKEKRE